MIQKHNAKYYVIALWVLIALAIVFFWLRPTTPKEDSIISASYNQPSGSQGGSSNGSATGTELQGNTASGTSIQGSNVNINDNGSAAKLLQGVQ